MSPLGFIIFRCFKHHQSHKPMSNDTAAKPQTDMPATGLPPLAAMAIALGLVLSVLIAAGAWKDVRKRPEKNNIRITGSARKRLVSDLIEWSASVEAKAPERTAAKSYQSNTPEKAEIIYCRDGGKGTGILQPRGLQMLREIVDAP